MKQQREAVEQPTPDGSRQIRRRGLLAAAIALGAGAVARLVSPGQAEAADGDNLVIGNIGTMTGAQTATSKTILIANLATEGLVVAAGASSPTHGISGNTTGFNKIGVFGYNPDAGGVGVGGFTLNGIGANGEAASVTALGVRGVNAGDGTGLKGVSNTGGVYGADGTGSGTGVHGKSNSGNGVLGQSNFGWGVAGSSGNNVGVYGTAGTGTGVYGTSNTYVGVYGNSTGAATGVFGASTNGAGGYFQSANNIGLEGVSMTPNVPAIYGVNTTGGAGKRAAQFDGDVLINGSYTATGLKSAAVPHPDGSLRRLYSLESPESYFEDFGEAGLEKGVALVALDPDFAVLVQTGSYRVFLTPEGDCRGVYVSSKGPQGFEVRELQGGTSSLPFSYRVVAKRKDVVAPRLEKLERERVKAFALKQYTAPSAPAIPPEQVFPEPARLPTGQAGRISGGPQPGVPRVPGQPVIPPAPQVPPGRR